jgi:hypothetical protein
MFSSFLWLRMESDRTLATDGVSISKVSGKCGSFGSASYVGDCFPDYMLIRAFLDSGALDFICIGWLFWLLRLKSRSLLLKANLVPFLGFSGDWTSVLYPWPDCAYSSNFLIDKSLTVIICCYLQFCGHLQWLIRCLEFGRHLLCNGPRRQLFALTGLSKYTFICILSCNELHLSRVWFLKLRRYISRSCNAAYWQRIPRLFSRFFFNCAALVAREVDVLVGRVKHLLGLYLNVHCAVYSYTRANSLGLGSAEWQLERWLSLLLALKNRVLCW